MNNNLPKSNSAKHQSEEIDQLTMALLETFHLDHCCQKALKQHYNCHRIEDAVNTWIIDTLTTPDKQLGTLVMPTLANRFHDYIESIRRLQ